MKSDLQTHIHATIAEICERYREVCDLILQFPTSGNLWELCLWRHAKMSERIKPFLRLH